MTRSTHVTDGLAARPGHAPGRRCGARRFSAGLLTALTASLGSATALAQLAAPFSNTIDVDPMYATGTNLTDVAWASDGRAVIVRKDGGVIIRRANATTVVRTGLFGTVDTASEKGLLGVVAHPDVATNNTFFFYVSNGTSNDDKHRVYRGVLDASDQLTIETNSPLIGASAGTGPGLRASSFGNHDGGGLFVHNRQLYVSVGDSGDNATPPTNKYSSCLNLGNGKILRINLDGTVPSDNPLANQAMVTSCTSTTGSWSSAAPDRRIFAWGLRNPWRFWVDPQTGLMWIGDVGETTREEISVGPAGSHFGYPFREGTTNYEGATGRGADGSLANMHCMTMTPSRTCTGPVHDYARMQGGANCVIGGLIPSGCGWSAALGGTLYYLFADHGGGWIRALTVRSDRMGVMSSTPTNFGTFSGASPRSFRMGPDESLYVVMSSSIHRFTPRDRTGCMGTGGMGGMGGMSGMGGRAGMGGAGRGGAGAGGASAGTSAGSGMTAGAGGVGMGGVGAGGAGAGGQAGSISPGGAGSGGDAGSGAVGGDMTTGGSGGTAGVSGTSTGGTVPSGGNTASGGVPVGGAPGAGMGAAPGAGADSGGDGDTDGGCGCRAAKGGGVGYLALALGLLFTFGARLRRRRRGV